MSGAQIFLGLLFLAIGLVMFYASVIEPDYSLAPGFTTFLSIFFMGLGVGFFFAPAVMVGIIAVCLYFFMIALALYGASGPFIYRARARGVHKDMKSKTPVHVTQRGNKYKSIFMEYDYDSQHLHGFSQNTISYDSQKYKHGQEYKIYVNPSKPSEFVTRKWGAFIGSVLGLAFLLLMGVGMWKQYMG